MNKTISPDPSGRSLKKLLFGTAYYPEQDPENEWSMDAKLMKDLGLNCIRIGEFCWSKLQRRDGSFNLDWLEKVIRIYADHGIKTILCTPTATPPIWIVEKYPDLACLTPDGREGLFGGRRHYSAFHEGYRSHCRAIAEALAERFGNNPSVIGWQIDNEVGSYSTIDCSASALRSFHLYIEKKYKTVEVLNQRWGLSFWNQEVEEFGQIPAPEIMMCTRNPSYLLDYNRFCIDGLAEFVLEQAKTIRKFAVDQFIVGSAIEEVQAAICRIQRDQDIKAIDEISVHNYPEIFAKTGELPMMFDRHRMLCADRRFYVLEQQSGSGSTTSNGLNAAIRRYWTFEALAYGAKSIFWFHWRRFRTGCEWRLPCILERDRQPRTSYHSIKKIIEECQKIEDVLDGSAVVGDIQILLSLDNVLARDRASEKSFWMEIQLPDGKSERFPLWEDEVLRSIYNPLCHLGLTLDFVHETADWDLAKPLIVPDLDICTESTARKLSDWCERGGTVICFPGAGERDDSGGHRDLCPPGILIPLFGVELKDYWPLESITSPTFNPATGKIQGNECSGDIGTKSVVRLGDCDIDFDVRHGEVLDAKSSATIGRYVQEPFVGEPAITENHIGKGRAIYMGAVPFDVKNAILFWRTMLRISPDQVDGYRTVKLHAKRGNYRFLLNKGSSPCALPNAVDDLISSASIEELSAWGIALVKDDGTTAAIGLPLDDS